jgi:hypothetical protein
MFSNRQVGAKMRTYSIIRSPHPRLPAGRWGRMYEDHFGLQREQLSGERSILIELVGRKSVSMRTLPPSAQPRFARPARNAVRRDFVSGSPSAQASCPPGTGNDTQRPLASAITADFAAQSDAEGQIWPKQCHLLAALPPSSCHTMMASFGTTEPKKSGCLSTRVKLECQWIPC